MVLRRSRAPARGGLLGRTSASGSCAWRSFPSKADSTGNPRAGVREGSVLPGRSCLRGSVRPGDPAPPSAGGISAWRSSCRGAGARGGSVRPGRSCHRGQCPHRAILPLHRPGRPAVRARQEPTRGAGAPGRPVRPASHQADRSSGGQVWVGGAAGLGATRHRYHGVTCGGKGPVWGREARATGGPIRPVN